MAKLTFIVSDESVNDRGYRILTDGIDTTQYERNPIMLLMHSRYKAKGTGVIGRWENLRKENGQLLADAVFDTDDEIGAKIEKQVKNGFLRMASISARPVETSTDAEHVLEGQTYATVTKCKLIEISIVDRGGNDSALKLYSNNGSEDYQLEKLSSKETPSENTTPEKLNNSMNIDQIKAELKLSATATEADVLAKIKNLSSRDEEFTQHLEAVKTTRRQTAQNMLKPLNLSAEDNTSYMELAEVNFDLFKKHVGNLKLSADSQKVNGFMNGLSNETKDKNLELTAKGFAWLSENNPEFLAELKANDPEVFEQLVADYENS